MLEQRQRLPNGIRLQRRHGVSKGVSPLAVRGKRMGSQGQEETPALNGGVVLPLQLFRVDLSRPFGYSFKYMEKLKLLLPKGRIYESVVGLLNGAGIKVDLPERAYRPIVNQSDLEAKVMKPQNIGKLLELGSHDAGFTGRDWIEETKADVEEIMDLGFDKVRIVAAVPNALDDHTL